MKTCRSAVFLVSAGLLAGCTHDVAPDPNRFNLEPERVATLKPGQAVALKNGYTSEDKVKFTSNNNTFVFDQQQYTSAAIATLGRSLEKQGIRIDPAADKAIILRVRIQKYQVQVNYPLAYIFARAGTEASFAGDGEVYVEADNPNPRVSGASLQMQAAIQSALRALVSDPKFVAYMNR